MLIEICANSVESLLAAEAGGALRVELCENLPEGGTTPSAGTLLQARELIKITLHVLIRPRGGDFLYNSREFDLLLRDVQIAVEAGADGIVTGVLLPDGSIDAKRMEKIIRCAGNVPVTFHRAFDMSRDPDESIRTLLNLGIPRVLTSGMQNKAWDGRFLLKRLIEEYGHQIIIMPGSGINESNIEEMVRTTRATEFHTSLRTAKPGQMVFRRSDIFMGGIPQIPEYDTLVTDPVRVRNLIQIAQNA